MCLARNTDSEYCNIQLPVSFSPASADSLLDSLVRLAAGPDLLVKAPAWFGAVTQGWSDCTVYCGWMNSCMTYTCCTIRAQSTLNNRVSETTLRRVVQGCRLNMSLHSALCSLQQRPGQVRSVPQGLLSCNPVINALPWESKNSLWIVSGISEQQGALYENVHIP